jgi:hypothetical protein
MAAKNTMRTREHLGTSFEVWSGSHTWFWFVADPRCSGASIGAAANETDAISEARLMIEEMAARWPGSAKLREIGKAIVRATPKCSPASSTDFGSDDLLANPVRYISRLCSECV